jgi:hypothetical protein
MSKIRKQKGEEPDTENITLQSPIDILDIL